VLFFFSTPFVTLYLEFAGVQSNSKMGFELSPVQHASIGAVVGSVEQSIMRPSVFWKTEMQQKRFDMYRAINPRFCYRGLPMAVVGIAPITCIQFGTNSAILNAFTSHRGGFSNVTDSDRLVAGVVAGMTSALVQSPCQLVEVNQQNHGGTIFKMIRRIHAAHGIPGFFRGLTMTMGREGIFCSSYIALNPLMQEKLKERGVNGSQASVYSAVATGTFGALLSHPADTLKTRLQGGVLALPGGTEGPRAPREALQTIARSGPMISQLYAGCAPRVFRLICCTYIYGSLTSVFEDFAHHCQQHWSWNAAGVDRSWSSVPTAARLELS